MSREEIAARGARYLEMFELSERADNRVEIGFQQTPPAELPQELQNLPGVAALREEGPLERKLRLVSREVIPAIIACVVSLGVPLYSVIPQRATLEDIYLKLQDLDEKDVK